MSQTPPVQHGKRPTPRAKPTPHEPATIEPIALELAAAATAIGVSVWTLRKFIAAKLLPTVRYPSVKNEGEQHGRTLIAVTALRAFVAKHQDVLSTSWSNEQEPL